MLPPPLDPLDPCHPSLSDPAYNPDEDEIIREARAGHLGSVLVILPLHEIRKFCESSLQQLGQLLVLEPLVAMAEAMKLAELNEYDQIVLAIRQLLLEAHPAEHIDMQMVHQFIDVLSDLHASIMEYFHRLYRKPYRTVRMERLIATDGLVLRVYPCA